MESMLVIKNFLSDKVMKREKISLTKNVKIINAENSGLLKWILSSMVENLGIKRHKIGSESVVDNNTDLTLKAILKDKKHPSIIAINGR